LGAEGGGAERGGGEGLISEREEHLEIEEAGEGVAVDVVCLPDHALVVGI